MAHSIKKLDELRGVSKKNQDRIALKIWYDVTVIQ